VKTLQLKNGDLVVGSAGHQVVEGTSKIRQDLAMALGEPYGDDRFHTGWGSMLPNYIGDGATDEVKALVVSETARVLQAYVDSQATDILRDSLAASRSRYATADVVRQVNGVDATLTLDTIQLKVSLTTQAGQNVVLTRTVSL
jgi:hypothetical protein